MSNQYAKRLAKLALDISPKMRNALITGGLVAPVAGLLSYSANTPAAIQRAHKFEGGRVPLDSKEVARRRKIDALASAARYGILSGALAHSLTLDPSSRSGRYRNPSDYYGGGGGGGGGASAAGPSWRDQFKNIYDAGRHGEKFKKVYDTVVNSQEVATPERSSAFAAFMKSVGTPGANVEELQRHMDNFPKDTAARQFMNILMNKHHGKQAHYVMPRRLKTASLIALYRSILRRR